MNPIQSIDVVAWSNGSIVASAAWDGSIRVVQLTHESNNSPGSPYDYHTHPDDLQVLITPVQLRVWFCSLPPLSSHGCLSSYSCGLVLLPTTVLHIVFHMVRCYQCYVGFSCVVETVAICFVDPYNGSRMWFTAVSSLICM